MSETQIFNILFFDLTSLALLLPGLADLLWSQRHEAPQNPKSLGLKPQPQALS